MFYVSKKKRTIIKKKRKESIHNINLKFIITNKNILHRKHHANNQTTQKKVTSSKKKDDLECNCHKKNLCPLEGSASCTTSTTNEPDKVYRPNRRRVEKEVLQSYPILQNQHSLDMYGM